MSESKIITPPHGPPVSSELPETRCVRENAAAALSVPGTKGVVLSDNAAYVIGLTPEQVISLVEVFKYQYVRALYPLPMNPEPMPSSLAI